VLFGGGTPTGFTTPVYTDDGRIGNGLTNKGEDVYLIDNNGHEIAVITHEDWPSKQSLVRHPPDGDELVAHKTVSTIKALFSPGQTHIIPKPDYPLFISEVLADPPTGAAGDANRDGRRDGYEDDFIELYNAGSESISLAGWRLGDSTALKNFFQFPVDAVIAPHSYIVLFGGGNPSGFTTPVYIDDGKIGNGLTSSGEDIRLIDDIGHEIDVVSHDEWPKDQSLVRNPPDGGPFVPHKTASPIELLFSPGHASTTRPLLTYPLFISEVLADPPEGSAGDANLDGQYDPHEDEFIELYNAGSRPISLAGWRLGDAGSLSDYFRFPRDAVIEPNSYVVLFGGGRPSEFTTSVYTDDGTIGDGLTDTGESIHLINDYGNEAAFLYQSTWPDDQSIVRTPSDSDTFVPHKTASPTTAPFSPGHTPETRPFLNYHLFISEVLADPPEGLEGDANRDGRYDPHKDEFIELYNAGSRPISLAGWRLGDAGSLSDYFRFPRDAVIEPNSYVVLFGGGRPSEFTTSVYTDDGTIGDGLTDTGESIHLINDYGNEAAFLYQSTWPDDQSIVRTPSDSDTFVPHKTASPTTAPFSPGHAPDDQPATPEVPETPEPETPSEPIPTYALFISEVLADPPSGAVGDANQDGQRDGYEDEFIELYNADIKPISLAGWRLGDNTSPGTHFQFPTNAVIEPGSYVVLFGGGNPSGFTVPVYTDDGRIGNGLTNKGEDIQLTDDAGNTIAVVSHGTWPKDQSLVRHPPDGDALVSHKTASPTEASFSPGRATDDEPETPEASETPEPETPSEPIPTYALFISEVLADPPTGAAGDANRDGRRDGYEDDFIELYNAGSESISLAGWRLGDSTALKNFFQFPVDAVIAPHSYIVLFGGGNPSGFTTPVYIDDGKIGNGLTSSGEDIRLIDDIGHEIDVVSHDEWPKDQSLVRNPPDGGPFVPHKTASPIELLFSPGHASTTRPLLTYPLFISEVLADPPEGSAGDANLDGQYDPHEDEFIELYNAGSRPISLAG
ncbi:MAG: lamin tail domain-containing protein, partial [Gemmatimonadetes bacterium]|nr:lamin tail domain-containing protein [Gemmatimonadota bacterium]